MTRKIIGVLALIVLGVTLATAQTNTVMTPSNLIDGSKTPDQIPITVILRFWLNSYTYNGTIKSVAFIGLYPADSAALTKAMANYQSQYSALVAPYQAAVLADVTNGTSTADRAGFWDNINSLVANTWAGLQATLSSAGLSKFTTYLNNEKSGLMLSPYDYGLGATAARNRKESQMIASMHPMVPQGTSMTPNYSGYQSISFSFTGSGTENFSQANGPLNSNWTTLSGAFAVASNALEVSSGGSGGTAWAAYNAGGSYSSEQCSALTLDVLPSGYQLLGVATRINTSQSYPSGTFYYAGFYNAVSWQGISMEKVVNGTPTSLGYYAYSMASGDHLLFCAKGTTLSANVNGTTILSVSDSSIASGSPGIVGTNGSGTAYGWGSYGTISMQVNASLSGDTTCPCPEGATHTPSINNSDGTTGSKIVWGAVPPQDYIDDQNNVTYPESDLEAGDEITLLSEIQCSIAGLFFSSGPIGQLGGLQVEIAFTMSVPNGTGSAGAWGLSPQCTAATTPPDYNPPFALFQSLAPGYLGESIPPCVRTTLPSKTPWICISGADLAQPTKPQPYKCSNWDAGNPGIVLYP
jgi:hypothetical protein